MKKEINKRKRVEKKFVKMSEKSENESKFL